MALFTKTIHLLQNFCQHLTQQEYILISLKIYFKKSYCFGSLSVTCSQIFYGIPFIESRFYRSPLVKDIYTKSAANNYLFTANNESTRTSCELRSKLTTKMSGRYHCSHSDVFIFNFEHFSCLALMFLLLNLSKYWSAGKSSNFFFSIY